MIKQLMRCGLLLFATGVLAFWGSAVAGQGLTVEPVGSEYQVNIYSANGQSRPAVAAGEEGSVFAVWQSEGQDGDGFGIYGRYLPTGPEIRVNATTVGAQARPGVGMGARWSEGVVAWNEERGSRPAGIFGRLISITPMSLENRISGDVGAPFLAPAVSANRNNNRYVVVWHDVQPGGNFNDIYGRLVNSSTEPSSNLFRVNSFTAGSELYPDVAMSDNGSFVVVWLSLTVRGHEGIYAQRYDSNANPVGAEITVASFPPWGDTSVYDHRPTVASDPAGNFVVAWSPLAEWSSTRSEISARRYYANGTPAGDELMVNSYTEGEQASADVAMDRRGNFIVVWQSPGQDGSGLGIYGQLYDGMGNRVGEEFQVNEFTTGTQYEPAVVMRPFGTWTVAWTSQGQDGSGNGVFARQYRYTAPEFVVNSTADPGDGVCTFGECTLREVITEAKAHAGSETITFAIPGEGPHTIRLTSPLPELTGGMTIDGYSQPGAQPNTNATDQGLNTRLMIELIGSLTLRNATTIKGIALSGTAEIIQNTSTIQGSFIGTNAAGTQSSGGGSIYITSGGGGAQIGGTAPAQRNLIVGQVYVGTYGTATLHGNLMGTDISGTHALGGGSVNAMNAYVTIGGDNPAARNLFTGVSLFEASADVRGNYIGVDVTGMQPLGNGGSVYTGFGAGATIANNLIAYTGGTPIIIGNSGKVSGNRIFANRGLGIDVGNDGVSLNDPGDLNSGGRGGKQNFPIINRAYQANGQTMLEGMLDSTTGQAFTLEFFANQACDPSGFGEGERPLGTAAVTTNANGKAVFQVALPATATVGEYLTAVATGSNNSSEFSPCRVLGALELNRLLAVTGYATTYDPTPVTNAPAGRYTLVATFVNRSNSTLRHLYYRITTLTGVHLVLNAEGGPVGAGGVVAVPAEVAPGATVTVSYVIGLQARTPFSFFVDAFGLTSDGAAANEGVEPGVGFGYASTDADFTATNAAGTPVYLPLVTR